MMRMPSTLNSGLTKMDNFWIKLEKKCRNGPNLAAVEDLRNKLQSNGTQGEELESLLASFSRMIENQYKTLQLYKDMRSEFAIAYHQLKPHFPQKLPDEIFVALHSPEKWVGYEGGCDTNEEFEQEYEFELMAYNSMKEFVLSGI